MALQLQNLDDRKYKDLMEEALSMIPTYALNWTDHNPSDPGITLIEMFAYLTEILIYRLNRVNDNNMRSFLKLLNGPQWTPSEQKTLTEEKRDTILEIRQHNRAVTCEDFENLSLAADVQVARTRCVPRRNLESESALASTIDKQPGHISVVIVPRSVESNPQPDNELIQTVKNYLEPKRLLTTQLHVVGPRYCTIGVQLTLVLKPDAIGDAVKAQMIKALRRFFHPLDGDPDEKGWPFGRNVFVSEIYELLDTQPGVDYVKKTIDQTTNKPLDEITIVGADSKRLERNGQGELVAVKIRPDELVDAPVESIDIKIESPIVT